MKPGRHLMDDGISALRNRPSRPRPAPPRGSARRRVQPHHRRRRAVALATLLGLVLVIAAAAGSGGGVAAHRAVQLPPGYFSRIQTLAGTGPGSFSAAEKAAENAAIDR